MRSILLFLVVFVGKSFAKVKLNELIPICEINDPNLNQCVVKSANLMIPVLVKGIKAYGFPPLDPLLIPKMNIGQNTGPVSLQLELIDTVSKGLSTLNFRSASIDTKKNRWILNGTLPYYELVGKYKGKGKMLLLQLNGNGNANFTLVNTGVDFVIDGAPKKQKEDVYFNLKSLRVYFTFNKTYMTLTNLFSGNKELDKAASQVLYENSDEVFRELKGPLDDVYSLIYTNLVRRITSNVPYNQLFKMADHS